MCSHTKRWCDCFLFHNLYTRFTRENTSIKITRYSENKSHTNASKTPAALQLVLLDRVRVHEKFMTRKQCDEHMMLHFLNEYNQFHKFTYRPLLHQHYRYHNTIRGMHESFWEKRNVWLIEAKMTAGKWCDEWYHIMSWNATRDRFKECTCRDTTNIETKQFALRIFSYDHNTSSVSLGTRDILPNGLLGVTWREYAGKLCWDPTRRQAHNIVLYKRKQSTYDIPATSRVVC